MFQLDGVSYTIEDRDAAVRLERSISRLTENVLMHFSD